MIIRSYLEVMENLRSDELRLSRPINVVVHSISNAGDLKTENVVEYPDLNIQGIGSSREDARKALCKNLIDVYLEEVERERKTKKITGRSFFVQTLIEPLNKKLSKK